MQNPLMRYRLATQVFEQTPNSQTFLLLVQSAMDLMSAPITFEDVNCTTINDLLIKHQFRTLDYLQIDTEGYELNVIKGFGDYIENIKVVQFEYGGTFLDNKTKMIDVINYLEQKGFHKFSYLTANGTEIITDFSDHYQYCNIVCVNKSCILPLF